MDRVISLLAALVGLIALGGAILVHVNGDAQRAEMATEIAQLRTAVGLPGAPVQVATGDPAPAHIPSAEHLSSSVASSSSSAPPPPSSSSSLAAMASIAPLEPVSSLAPPSAGEAMAAASSASSFPPPPGGQNDQLAALQAQVAALLQANKDQASQLDAARAQLAHGSSSVPPASSAAPQVAEAGEPSVSVPAPLTPPPSQASPSIPAAIAADGPTKDCIPLNTRFMGSTGDSFPICKTHMVLKVAAVMDGQATITGPGDIAAGATVPYEKGCSVQVFSADSSGYAEMRVTCP